MANEIAWTTWNPVLITSGLSLYLNPNTYTSGATWNDSSSNAYNATLVGSPTYTSNGLASSFALNGTTQYVSVPAASAQMINMYSGGFTYSFWVKLANLSTEQVLVAKESSDNTSGQFITIHQNTVPTFDLVINSSGISLEHSYDITSAISLNTWVNLVVTYIGGSWPGNPANSHLYINGTEVGSTSGTSKVYATPTGTKGTDAAGLTTFGYSGFTDFFSNISLGARFSTYTMGQLLVYNRALSTNEVVNNFTVTRSNYGI